MIEKKHLIRGAKGNDPPPSPPQPTREPDTLHSRQFATFLDLVSEGEIEGFATASKEGRTKGTTAYNNAALKDVFLNDTPVLRASADSTNPQTTDFNFQDVSLLLVLVLVVRLKYLESKVAYQRQVLQQL